uniref:Uncharacterized protein n=1 Tax=Avena sativa TaxID=4498 RepID=A0ACD5Z4C8_AVESA
MALAAHTRAVLLVVALSVLGLATGGLAQLKTGFYTGKCGGNDVETIVQGLVKARVARDAAIVAQLLRLQFHECAVNGCDGGLLVDGPGSEKTALPNLSVKGYDLIAAIKTELEKRCPGVVSCSDIEILATRDAVALAGGQRYTVRTGRRDRRRSSATDVRLPGKGDTAAQATSYFGRLGFDQLEMVVLLGAHTVGVTHCNKIKKTRLYSYRGKPGATDPSLHRDDAQEVCVSQHRVVGQQYLVPETHSRVCLGWTTATTRGFREATACSPSTRTSTPTAHPPSGTSIGSPTQMTSTGSFQRRLSSSAR